MSNRNDSGPPTDSELLGFFEELGFVPGEDWQLADLNDGPPQIVLLPGACQRLAELKGRPEVARWFKGIAGA